MMTEDTNSSDSEELGRQEMRQWTKSGERGEERKRLCREKSRNMSRTKYG